MSWLVRTELKVTWSVFETYCQNTDRDTFLTPRFQFFSLWHTTDDSPRTSSHTSQPSQLSVNVPWFWLPQCSAQRTFWKEKLILLWPDIDVFLLLRTGAGERKSRNSILLFLFLQIDIRLAKPVFPYSPMVRAGTEHINICGGKWPSQYLFL